jgi:hypothetical protein
VTESDRQYFSRRADEESNAAAGASHPTAKRAHLDLAQRYHDLAHAIDRHEKGMVLQFVAPEKVAHAG